MRVEDTSKREESRIAVGPALLDGILNMPAGCPNVVLFAGDAGSRLNPANRFLARELRTHGVGTFLFDLLTAEEELCYRTRVDVDLLTTRLVRGLIWLRGRPELKNAAVGLFGTGAGAAATLNIAARSTDISAVVTRGGRPDLAERELRFVRCPTLLIAGSRDYDLLRLSRHALEQMACRKDLAIVADATGALEEVKRLTVDWFELYLKADPAESGPTRIAAAG
jgi:dienelactone hydrolase